MEDKKSIYVKLEDLKSLRDGVSFHFTSSSNIESILSTGLRPTIGDNSKGGLGKEALDKTFISYGLPGVMQLYNRLINVSFEQTLHTIRDEAHAPFLPDSSSSKGADEHLSLIEGFEFLRQYMSNNVYFIAHTPVSKYEHELSADDIKSINEGISQHLIPGTNVKIKSRIDELDDMSNTLRDRLSSLEKDSPEYTQIMTKLQSISKERANLTITLRQITLRLIDQKRGHLIDTGETPVLDRVDYNEERLRWVDQFAHPHNTHTRIIEDEEGMHGVKITPDMLQLFSKDGNTYSSGIDFLETAFPRTTSNDTLAISEDFQLISYFLEYINLVKQYSKLGLLDKKPASTYTVR